LARLSPGIQDRDVLVIRMNHRDAGFFAQVQFAINQIRYAEARRLIPVVHYGADSIDGTNPYYEEAAGPNVWEYYFEPVAGLTLDDARALAARAGRRILTLSHWELWRLHHWEPTSVFTYPYGYFRVVDDKTTHLDARWWAAQRAEGRRLVGRYVRVRAEIRERVERYVAEHWRTPMLGVHLRGTDKDDVGAGPRLSRIVPPAEYFPLIDDHLDRHRDAGIFVATDQSQFRDEIVRRYGDRVVWCAEMLSASEANVFKTGPAGGRGNRAKGEEVLVDALLLARCDRLLKCTSAVGEFAQYFSRTLTSADVTDLNLAGLGARPRIAARTALRRRARRAELAARRVAWHAGGLAVEEADRPHDPGSRFPVCLPAWAHGHYPAPGTVRA
jgi:hypothetical protein